LRASLLLAMSEFLDPGRGPDQSGDFRVSPTFFIVLFGVGFLLAAFGHLVKSRGLTVTGVLLVFLATVLLPIAYSVSD
jgi:multisubunit Na+/H+ antiporter MnhB subunit